MPKKELVRTETRDGYEWRLGRDWHHPTEPAFVNCEPDSMIRMWYKFGKLHRVGAPAIYWEGCSDEEWYQNGQLHRTDGPAYRVLDNGMFINGYYLWGEYIESPDKFRKMLGWTKEQILFFQLKWGWFEKA